MLSLRHRWSSPRSGRLYFSTTVHVPSRRRPTPSAVQSRSGSAGRCASIAHVRGMVSAARSATPVRTEATSAENNQTRGSGGTSMNCAETRSNNSGSSASARTSTRRQCVRRACVPAQPNATPEMSIATTRRPHWARQMASAPHRSPRREPGSRPGPGPQRRAADWGVRPADALTTQSVRFQNTSSSQNASSKRSASRIVIAHRLPEPAPVCGDDQQDAGNRQREPGPPRHGHLQGENLGGGEPECGEQDQKEGDLRLYVGGMPVQCEQCSN
jgi:hypothetical protein